MSKNFENTTYTCEQIFNAINDKTMDFPRHQRNFIVSKKSQMLKIESIILGLPINTIMTYDTNENGRKITMVNDGQQRIKSIVNFMRDEFPIVFSKEARELDPATCEINDGLRFSELDPHTKKEFLSYEIPCFRINGNRNEMVKHIYTLVNTTGKVMSSFELNWAIYDEYTQFSEKLINEYDLINFFRMAKGNDRFSLNGAIEATMYKVCCNEMSEILGINANPVNFGSESTCCKNLRKKGTNLNQNWKSRFEKDFTYVVKTINDLREDKRELAVVDPRHIDSLVKIIYDSKSHKFNFGNMTKAEKKKIFVDFFEAIKETFCGRRAETGRGYKTRCQTAIEMFEQYIIKDNGRRRVTKNERMSVYNRDNGTCQICGKHVTYNEAEIDHIIPYSKGGKTEMSNLQVTCKHCNASKKDKVE